jgi:DNA (cytosine-5)-methyltransferase 1
VIHLGDITKIKGDNIPPVDVITFGSPCQDLSIAGKRAGLSGERSGLFMEAVRIIKEMREATNGQYPKYAVWENVPGAFSSNKGEDFRAVLEELARIKEAGISIPGPDKSKWAKAGLITGNDWSIAWRTMDAQYWGVPQRRLRISLVLDLTGGRAGEILFEPESLRGHFAPGVTPGQATAGTVENGAGTADCTEAIPVNLQIATRHKSLGERTGLGVGQAGDAAYTLQEGHEHGVCCPDIAKAYTLKIRSGCEGGGKGALVQTEKSVTDYTAITLQGDTVVGALLARDYKGVGREDSFGRVIAQPVGADLYNGTLTGDKAVTLTVATAKGGTNTGPSVIEKITRWIVRRLTPTECERLQGYPDGWTDLGEWIDSKGKAHKAADTPRYKALGNSIALPQWYYVLGGIADRLPDNATIGSLFDGIGGFPYVWTQLHSGRKELCVWASEIEEFPIAVTKKWFAGE